MKGTPTENVGFSLSLPVLKIVVIKLHTSIARKNKMV
jgi:hypothetical protein